MTDTRERPDSLAPAFLLSMPQLNDPNFKRTVVLLCQHTDEGAWGLVLNRPTGKSAAIATSEGETVNNRSGLEVWVGGPVELERGCLLLGDPPAEGDSLEVCEGLFLSGSPILLQQLLESPTTEHVRLFMGYAGWGPGQLERELRESAWLISDVALDLVFETDPGAMWEAAIRRLGADPGTLQTSSGVH
ncbi:MAG: YqgE/AlgH family protein [Bacteroidales bacterium]